MKTQGWVLASHKCRGFSEKWQFSLFTEQRDRLLCSKSCAFFSKLPGRAQQSDCSRHCEDKTCSDCTIALPLPLKQRVFRFLIIYQNTSHSLKISLVPNHSWSESCAFQTQLVVWYFLCLLLVFIHSTYLKLKRFCRVSKEFSEVFCKISWILSKTKWQGQRRERPSEDVKRRPHIGSAWRP